VYSLFDASENFYGIKRSVEELVPLLKENGIVGINPPAEMLEDPGKAMNTAAFVYDNGMKWGLLPTPVDFFSPHIDDRRFEEALEKLKKWAGTGEKIGIKRCYNHVYPGHNEWDYSRNFEWHVIRIECVNRVLRNHGIQYGLEFLGPYDLRNSFKKPFVHSLAGVLALAGMVDISVGFVFDTFHWYTGGTEDDLYCAAGIVDRMVCFHINDGIAGKRPEEQQDTIRAMPMTTAVIDSLKAYKLFRDRGYSGPVICEPMNPAYQRFSRMAPEKVVKEIACVFRKMESRIT
jgi:sugar phosphate isomerase/epimerase